MADHELPPDVLALVRAARRVLTTARMSAAIPIADPSCLAEVSALGNRIGFGNLMATASVAWRNYLQKEGWPVGGEFACSPCRRTAELDAEALSAALKPWGESDG